MIRVLAIALFGVALKTGGVVAGLFQAAASFVTTGVFLSPEDTFGVVYVAFPILLAFLLAMPVALAVLALRIWRDL